MGNPNERDLVQLERDWPHWQVWTVYQAVGGTVWCARRRDDHKKVINADSAEHLAEYLENEVSKPIDHGWLSGTCGAGPDGAIPLLDMPATGDLLREMYPGWTITRDEALGAWTAEKRDGNELHFLAAIEAWELSLKIKAAEQAEQ
jgi:hypothetical protein